jgi:hypothetical protein
MKRQMEEARYMTDFRAEGRTFVGKPGDIHADVSYNQAATTLGGERVDAAMKRAMSRQRQGIVHDRSRLTPMGFTDIATGRRYTRRGLAKNISKLEGRQFPKAHESESLQLQKQRAKARPTQVQSVKISPEQKIRSTRQARKADTAKGSERLLMKMLKKTKLGKAQRLGKLLAQKLMD